MNYDVNVHRIVRQKKGDHQYIERHSHDFFHYIYVLNGVGKVIVGAQVFDVSKYDLILIPPKTEHEVYGKNGLISMDIKFSCDTALTEKLSCLPHYMKHLGQEEDRLLKTVFEEALEKNRYFEELINARVLELLLLILRRSGGREKALPMVSLGTQCLNHRRKEIEPALNYIEQKLNEPLRVCDVAAFMGFSVAYFSTLFKEIMGQPPISYINGRKCDKAKELMFYSNLNITQIAEELGYESVHYFSRVFKKNAGISPRAFLSKGAIDVVIHVKESRKNTGYEIPIRNLQDHSIQENKPFEL